MTRDEYVSLRYDASADPEGVVDMPDGTSMTVLLFTRDGYATYGIPANEQGKTGPFHWRPYPHQYWKQITSLQQQR
ncbi:hypothetical protein KSF_106450 [Reticulibacter mediterranei]|uniref:Uncharacterized protein n=1 Tax=Reticulibacter mediterranei TaxID=2778369 RepID=A0A8J3N6Q3_9CHLR|nr:hypothetical protein [Reticulibacter mediterranei]GHP00598.1 hypothetical protein KSF_106450 [Reticulibacter mediterranei]